jgi:hypothetical protein
MVVMACDVMNNAQLYSVFVASHCELSLLGDDTPGDYKEMSSILADQL